MSIATPPPTRTVDLRLVAERPPVGPPGRPSEGAHDVAHDRVSAGSASHASEQVPARASRPVPIGTEPRGFALYVGVDGPDAPTGPDLRQIVAELRARLAEIAPGSEAYASVVVAPAGAGGRSVDVVRRTLAVPRDAGSPGVLRRPVPARPRTLVVDLSRSQVTVDGDPAALTYLELRLLAHLVRCSGRTVPRAELVRTVWAERDDVPSERTVDVHVRRLRQKLGRYEDVVRTVRGVGYRFDEHADVRVVTSLPGSGSAVG